MTEDQWSSLREQAVVDDDGLVPYKKFMETFLDRSVINFGYTIACSDFYPNILYATVRCCQLFCKGGIHIYESGMVFRIADQSVTSLTGSAGLIVTCHHRTSLG